MAINKISVKVSYVWWFNWFYRPGVSAIILFFQYLGFDVEINESRYLWFLSKAIRIEITDGNKSLQ